MGSTAADAVVLTRVDRRVTISVALWACAHAIAALVVISSWAGQTALRADQERMRMWHQDILGQREIQLFPLTESAAARELTHFAQELRQMPNMEGYFDRGHLANLRQHQHEAQHGFATLPAGGILEILSLPTMPNQVMGFHLFIVFDPKDDADKGGVVGYTIWSLERGNAPFGQAEAVRMAFDIFPPYRGHRYRKVAFTHHDIYNISRRILYHHKPWRFLVDARTQISQTRTGRMQPVTPPAILRSRPAASRRRFRCLEAYLPESPRIVRAPGLSSRSVCPSFGQSVPCRDKWCCFGPADYPGNSSDRRYVFRRPDRSRPR
jgi:hypothetical protein